VLKGPQEKKFERITRKVEAVNTRSNERKQTSWERSEDPSKDWQPIREELVELGVTSEE